MNAPNESLEDFFASAPERMASPPPVRSVRPSGAIEVLKPLTPSEDSAKGIELTDSGTFVPQAPFPVVHREFSWFHRSLAVGGLLATVAFVTSSIFIAISDPPVEQAGIQHAMPADVLPGAPPRDWQERDPFAAFPAENFPDPEELRVDPAAVRRSSARPRVLRAAYRPRRINRRMVISQFVPTTLVIYPENGEIKTRIERQVTAFYNRSFRTS